MSIFSRYPIRFLPSCIPSSMSLWGFQTPSSSILPIFSIIPNAQNSIFVSIHRLPSVRFHPLSVAVRHVHMGLNLLLHIPPRKSNNTAISSNSRYFLHPFCKHFTIVELKQFSSTSMKNGYKIARAMNLLRQIAENREQWKLLIPKVK